MRKTLIIGLGAIIVLVLAGGLVAFRELRAAEDSVHLLVEGHRSLLARGELRDLVIALRERSRQAGSEIEREEYARTVERAIGLAARCNVCHDEEDSTARSLIDAIDDKLGTVRDLPAAEDASRAVGRELDELGSLLYSATRAGEDLVERRAGAARERIALGGVIIAGIAVFSLLILILVSLLVLARIRAEVSRVVEATRILVGQGHAAVDWAVFRDEFHSVGQALRSMAEQLDAKEKRERETLSRSLQAERVLSLARFAGGLAHEVNNPLSGVVGFTELLLQRSSKLDATERQYLERIRESGNRAAKIVQTLMNLSDSSGVRPEPTGLDVMTAYVVEGMLEGEAGEGRQKLDLRLSPAPACVDREQIQQVVFCLVDNAFRAVQGRADASVRIETFIEGGTAVLRVTDTGPGIPQDQIDHVFDPFFTTREAGSGTGLGLAVSRQIVERLKGSITLKSPPEGGTVVEVCLPVPQRSGTTETCPGV